VQAASKKRNEYFKYHKTTYSFENLQTVMKKILNNFIKYNEMRKLFFLSFILFLFSLCTCYTAFSQDLYEYKNQIKFSPIRMINLLNPGFELSYERKNGRKFSTQISVAYLVDCIQTTQHEKYSGYRILLEEKLFHFNYKFFKQYVSLETGYYAVNMISSANFMPKGIDRNDDLYFNSKYEDIFNMNRTGIIVNSKYGVQFLIKRLTFDTNIGFGIIIHNITHSNRLNPDDKWMPSSHTFFYNLMVREGKRLMPNFPFTFKVGYLF